MYQDRTNGFNPEKFLSAQRGETGYSSYDTALAEIRSGNKVSHWIWYVFPQLRGLGKTDLSWNYGITGIEEAREYLAHPVLGARLLEITEALYRQEGRAIDILHSPDDKKVRSCMTLFLLASPETEIFQKVLDKFYKGRKDGLTLSLLNLSVTE